MAQRWYYARGGQKIGPVTREGIGQRTHCGTAAIPWEEPSAVAHFSLPPKDRSAGMDANS